MTLTPTVAAALARQCAPQVAVPTMVALVSSESGLDPYAIGDNSTGRSYHLGNAPAAAAQATALVAAGHSIDMGLAQINSRTAGALGLSIQAAFDPCRNLAAAQRLMVNSYRRLSPSAPTVQHAISGMLSTYNTGDSRRGVRNGYVARVYASAARLRPALIYDPAVAKASPAVSISAPLETPPPAIPLAVTAPAAPPAWRVFGGAAAAGAMVFETPRTKGRTL